MDKQFLYLRVKTDSSVEGTPNPKENYVLIYPVEQEIVYSDNSQSDSTVGYSSFSIHFKGSDGRIYDINSKCQKKINDLWQHTYNLQNDLILILKEIVGEDVENISSTSDISNSSFID